MFNDSLHNIFRRWGKKEFRVSKKNDEIKIRALSALQTTTHTDARAAARMPFRIPRLAIALAGLAVLAFFVHPGRLGRISDMIAPGRPPAINQTAGNKTTGDFGLAAGLSSGSAMGLGSPSSYYPQPYPQPETPVGDTREFLKTDYNATLRTRHVQDLGRRLDITIHGFGGRVDSTSLSEKYGYISFVIPKNQFDAFKGEVQSMVGTRFIVENVSSQNLLPQKNSIEDQTANTQSSLTALHADRTATEERYRASLSILERQRLSVSNDRASLEKKLKEMSEQGIGDTARIPDIEASINDLKKEERRLAAIISAYQQKRDQQLSAIDGQISMNESILKNLGSEDRALLDTVATVRGTISLQWVSIPDIIGLYVPSDYWLPALLFAAAILAILAHRRRRMDAFPAV